MKHLVNGLVTWAVLFVGFLYLVAPHSGDGDKIDGGLSGSHVVIVRSVGSMGLAADTVVNSQDVEAEATVSGGNYVVYSDTVDLNDVAHIYQIPVATMLKQTERPLWYIASDATDIESIENIPTPYTAAVSRIKEVRGAR